MHTILYLNATGEISGAEQSLLAMLDALERDRFLPVVAAPDGPLLREAAARGARVEPVELSLLRRPVGAGEAWALLRRLRAGWREVQRVVERVKPDLVHANTTPAMLYALRIAGPVIWQVRDLTPLRTVGRMLYRKAARVAVISSAVREDIRQYGNEDKCMLLPPAVDTGHFHPVADKVTIRIGLGLPTDIPLIGMIAQFVPWKRHHLFLDALELIMDRPWHAVLAGADLHHDALYLASLRERIAQPPLAGRVTWLPWQQDPAPLMAALDICALTSDNEPFGRVLIEAMACGVPVVAMDDPGPRDIVIPGETGLLCPPDANKIADAFVNLLDLPERREALGEAGRDRVKSCFSLVNQREELTALYEAVLPHGV